MFRADRPGTLSFNKRCNESQHSANACKHIIKIENTPALGREAQIASWLMPQDVFRDTSDNILLHFTVKTISYFWQGAACIHLLGAAQQRARQYEPNRMAVCCRCNEALLFWPHLLLQYHSRTTIDSKLKQENIFFFPMH